MENGIPE